MKTIIMPAAAQTLVMPTGDGHYIVGTDLLLLLKYAGRHSRRDRLRSSPFCTGDTNGTGGNRHIWAHRYSERGRWHGAAVPGSAERLGSYSSQRQPGDAAVSGHPQ